ncbi:MAG: hypothetical protein NZ555_07985 [Geminicoccaceae bacterium]|nr:hypothetical protein [Geminicoccaceae bacterium]MDW8369833.1 hypothetical protein [Geminicoccaceae bacterium]
MAGSFHERLDSHDRIEGPSDRSFGLTVGGILVAIGLAKGLLFSGWTWLATLLLAAGGLLILMGLVVPALLAPANRAWMALGLLLFKIVNPVVMFLIYATTVVPIGLLLRLRGKDLLRLRRDPAAASYWISREPPGPRPESMRNQF